MLLCCRLAELMVKVDPSLYRKYITTSKKGVLMLYVKLTKALYRLLRSALLFYKKIRGDLEGLGFKINPYDPCVANKDINGEQLTVVWHVDDLKVSHKDENVVLAFCVKMSQLYGSSTKSSRGKVYNFLGMDLDWSRDGVFIVSMIKYLQKVIKDFPEEICATRATQANNNLFKIIEDGKAQLLPEEQAQASHHTTAQLLFLAMRARPDV